MLAVRAGLGAARVLRVVAVGGLCAGEEVAMAPCHAARSVNVLVPWPILRIAI